MVDSVCSNSLDRWQQVYSTKIFPMQLLVQRSEKREGMGALCTRSLFPESACIILGVPYLCHYMYEASLQILCSLVGIHQEQGLFRDHIDFVEYGPCKACLALLYNTSGIVPKSALFIVPFSLFRGGDLVVIGGGGMTTSFVTLCDFM